MYLFQNANLIEKNIILRDLKIILKRDVKLCFKLETSYLFFFINKHIFRDYIVKIKE